MLGWPTCILVWADITSMLLTLFSVPRSLAAKLCVSNETTSYIGSCMRSCALRRLALLASEPRLVFIKLLTRITDEKFGSGAGSCLVGEKTSLKSTGHSKRSVSVTFDLRY